ncbi:MAG: adenosine deaminase [Bacteroidales bacterium]
MNPFSQFPKVELHLHLDCSLSFEIVKKLNPAISFNTFFNNFVAPQKCLNLADYISRAMQGFRLMQSKESLRLVTLDLFEQLKKDQVIYAEIRFAPLQHIYEGLSAYEVVKSVNEAVVEGIRLTGVEAGIILCTLRHYNESQSLQTIELVKDFKGSKVVGFDLAADEAGFPVDEHIKAFEFAHVNGIDCTAHAGEAKGAESVWETLKKLKPKRIGHGVRSIEDQELLAYLLKENIHLEICPTSNIQVNVFDRIENHPVNQLYKSGISVGINTDARTISAVTLSGEYKKLADSFGWKTEDFMNCNLQALEHAFVSGEKKEFIRQKLVEKYKNLL